MANQWARIARAEFFVLTARFKGRRKLYMGLLFVLGLVWAIIIAPIAVDILLSTLNPAGQTYLGLQVMLPGLMRAVMLLLWMLLLLPSLTQALSEIKIEQWEILLSSGVSTRDILVGSFLGKIPSFTMYVLFLAPPLLSPFLLAFRVSLLGQVLVYSTLLLVVLTAIWLSTIIGAAIQAKLGESPRGNDIAKALAMLMGLITILPVLGLQFFAAQLSMILGLNIFLVLPFTWSADLLSWFVIAFNGIDLAASQITGFQSILQFDLLTSFFLMSVFGAICMAVGVISADRVFTYRIGVRTETIRTVKRENIIIRGLRKLGPISFGLLVATCFKTFFRKVQNLSKIVMALTLAAIMPILVILVYGQRYPLTLDSLLPITAYALAMMGIIAFSGTSFIESKDQLWLIQAAPHGASRFIKSRLLVAFLIALPLGVIPSLIVAIMMSLDLNMFLGFFVYSYTILCSAAMLGTGITAISPNFEDVKSPVHTTNMMIAMMICLFSTMAGPLIISIITRVTMGASLDTILVAMGIAEGIGRALISTALLLVCGLIMLLAGARCLGRPD